jgi:plasmid stabilization system protein ParE
VKVKFTPDARDSIRHKRAWWQEHREKAPKLFRDELAQAIRKLRSGALEGSKLYAVRGNRKIWRILMPKTRHHVYFWRNAAGDYAEILLVENAQGGSEPDFSL